MNAEQRYKERFAAIGRAVVQHLMPYDRSAAAEATPESVVAYLKEHHRKLKTSRDARPNTDEAGWVRVREIHAWARALRKEWPLYVPDRPGVRYVWPEAQEDLIKAVHRLCDELERDIPTHPPEGGRTELEMVTSTFKHTLKRIIGRRGRDWVRKHTHGKLLDALAAGRSDLHPDDWPEERRDPSGEYRRGVLDTLRDVVPELHIARLRPSFVLAFITKLESDIEDMERT